jgi:hypothetical protein
MPTPQKPSNFIEEKDLPKGWEDDIVDRPPVIVGNAPPPNPALSGANAYTSGALPPVLGLQPDLVRSQIAGNFPVHRLMPVSPAGLSQANSATSGNVPINQSVIAAAKAAAAAQTQATSAIAGVVALQATSFLGAYSNTFSYAQGASVDSGGTIYVSLINANVGNNPATSPSDWVATGGSNTSVFLGGWNSGTAYVIGNQVTFGTPTGYYIALANNTNSQPNTHPANWQLISSTNTDLYEGVYNSGTAYVPGNFVSYTDGNFYVCISNTTGNAPSPTGSSFWTLLGSSAVLLGAWSSATAYPQGSQVTLSGNIFIALQANTNHTPPTPPATNAFWQLVGPASLDNLANGLQNFAATAAGLSYTITSNPLTATDAGSSATVSIASFNVQTSSQGLIAYNSGSITALSYSTLYYIYFSSPQLSGGSPTYLATTSKSTALNGSGNIFLGSIQTPASGGAATSGNSDGGASVQVGMTALVPTTSFSGTYGTASATGGNGIATSANPSLSETWTGMVPASNDLMAYSKVLSVRSSCTITGIGNALLKYSLNGGGAFTVIYNTSSSLSSQVYTVTLPSGQDLTQVQVFGQVNYSSGAGTHVNQLVSGISVTEIS